MAWRNIPQSTSISELRRLTYNTDEELSPGEFATKYEDEFPVLMRVAIGYCGQNAIDFTFSMDEVYLVTHVLRQERVILKDSRDQNLSFPVDHRLTFYTIIEGEKSTEAQKLQDILNLDAISMTSAAVFLEPKEIPGYNIQFCVGPDKTVKLPMEVMQLVESYDERYMVGNSITHEILHYQPFTIPLWMPISVNIATGINHSTELKLNELLRDLTIMCRDFKNSTFPGNKGISENPAGIYGDIVWNNCGTVLADQIESVHKHAARGVSEIMLFTGDINEYEGPYDLIAPNNSEYCVLPPKRELNLQKSTESNVAPEVPDRKQSTDGSKDHRKPPSIPKQEKSLLNKLKGKFGKSKEKTDTEGYLVAQNEATQSGAYSYDSLSSETGTKPNTYVRTGNVSNKSSDSEIPYTKAKKTIVYSAKPMTGNQNHVEEDEDEGTYDDEYELFDATELNKRRSLPPIPAGEEKSKDASSGSQGAEQMSGDGVVKPKTAPKPPRKPGKPAPGLDHNVPNQAEMAGSIQSLQDDPEYISYKEIPKSLKGMSVKQVSECLTILHMEEYIAQFKENDIDGELLSELNSEELADLGLNKFQIKKMQKFQNGWRPKKGGEKD